MVDTEAVKLLEAQLASKEQQLMKQKTSYDAQIEKLNGDLSVLKQQLRVLEEDNKRVLEAKQIAFEQQLQQQRMASDAQLAEANKKYNSDLSVLKQQLLNKDEDNKRLLNLHDQLLTANRELQLQSENDKKTIHDLNQVVIAKQQTIDQLKITSMDIERKRAERFVGELLPLKDYLVDGAYPLSPPTPFKTFDHVQSGAEVDGVCCTSYTSRSETRQLIAKVERPGRNVEREFQNLRDLGKSKHFVEAIALVGVDRKILLLERCGHDLRCFLGGKHFSEYINLQKIAECVDALHNLNYCHNDIKLEVGGERTLLNNCFL